MIDIELSGQGAGWEPAPDVTPQLLGIVNEALGNVARHAVATQAWVDVTRTADGSLLLTVRDNGQGFDVVDRGVAGSPGSRQHAIPCQRDRRDVRDRERTRFGNDDLDHTAGRGEGMRDDG